jgi:2-aminoethylphosphonate-pyruvate transaminase
MAAGKLLFTPGPLSTTATVKQAMLRDLGSRDGEFLALVQEVRATLLRLAGVAEPEYTALPLQGSGTYAVEAALGALLPRGGRLLVAQNGAYGQRLAQLARAQEIDVRTCDFAETEPVDARVIAEALDAEPELGAVALVHCETSTGLVNPVAEIAEAARARGRRLLVDAMSSFGALPCPLSDWQADALVTSANKCLQGVPGLALILAKRGLIAAAQGRARAVSLDLAAQLAGLDRDGQFRFTPPTHVLLALRQALHELAEEGGPDARLSRYGQNQQALLTGMRALGFQTLLEPSRLSPIITSFLMPQRPGFDFPTFYRALSERGFVIYPGKVSRADCFRVGTIGNLFPRDVEALVLAIASVLRGPSAAPSP